MAEGNDRKTSKSTINSTVFADIPGGDINFSFSLANTMLLIDYVHSDLQKKRHTVEVKRGPTGGASSRRFPSAKLLYKGGVQNLCVTPTNTSARNR